MNRERRKIELLACAMWAKEKCTTHYGININAWLEMNVTAKKMWITNAKLHLAAPEPSKETK